jgi:hypothetical protein
MGDSMSTIINATTTNGVVIQPDNSGSLVLQTNNGNTALTIDTSQNVTLAGTLAMSSSFMRNRIINGDMSIWQRGTSTTLASYGYLADRWASGNFVSTQVSRSTSVPTGFQYSLKIQRAVSSTNTTAVATTQTIESNNCYDLSGQIVTLSFWAKAGANFSASGSNLNVQLHTGTTADQGGNFPYYSWAGNATSINTTVVLSTTWTKYTITSSALGAGILEMAPVFYFSPTGTAGADDSFFITGVQLEVGTSATPFERRLYNQELANCQRYYETTAVNGAFSISETQAQIVWNTAYCTSPQFKVTKRATPTVTIYSRAGTSGQVSSTASGANVSAATASNISATGIWSINLSTGQTVYSAGMEVGFTASAEL